MAIDKLDFCLIKLFTIYESRSNGAKGAGTPDLLSNIFFFNLLYFSFL